MCLHRELPSLRGAARLMKQFVALEFFSKCAAVDAENSCGLALVSLRVVHHSFEQGSLYFAHDKIIEVTRSVTVQRGKVTFQCVFGVFAERFLALGSFEVS
jgi:hypothetical protein